MTTLAPGPARVVAAYGLRIASTFPFRFAMLDASGEPDLRFAMVGDAPLPAGWERTAPSFDTTLPGQVSAMVDRVVRVGDCVVVRFDHSADFFLWDDRILCQLHDARMAHGVEIWLFGTVLALWLELRGLPTLHAASVVVDGHAASFLASSKGGKSTLAMTLVQGGAALLGDDQLPLERRGDRTFGRPGYPQMRLWPEQAEHLLGCAARLEPVQPGSPKLRVPVGLDGVGTFHAEAAALRALYLPQRDASDVIEIVPVAFGEALLALVRHSFLAGVLEALGLAPQRFHTFAALLRQAPLRQVRYPSGTRHLGAVREAILGDLTAAVEQHEAPR